MSDAQITHAPDTRAPEDAALATALSDSPRPAPPSPLSAVLTFGWRGMLKIRHTSGSSSRGSW